jgi:hypothetical protein
MSVAKTTIWSWLAVTIIYLLTLFIDGMPLNFNDTSGIFAFCALVGFIVGIYFAFFGGIAWYVLSKRDKVTRRIFILAGVIASIPMLVFCILSGELEWVFATILAGVIAGAIYAFQLPTYAST